MKAGRTMEEPVLAHVVNQLYVPPLVFQDISHVEIAIERNRHCNVRKGAWHQVIVSGMRCLVVENADMSLEDGERLSR